MGGLNFIPSGLTDMYNFPFFATAWLVVLTYPSAFWCGYLGLPVAGIYIYNHNVLGEWLGKAIGPGMAGEVQQQAELKRESFSGLVETCNWFESHQTWLKQKNSFCRVIMRFLARDQISLCLCLKMTGGFPGHWYLCQIWADLWAARENNKICVFLSGMFTRTTGSWS